MKNYLAYASEIYPLKIKDVLNLADSQNNDSSALPAEKVVILLGNADANQPDTLLCGRERLNRLQTEGQTHADVCLAYHTLPPLAGFFANMIKPIKRRYYATSANTYHTSFHHHPQPSQPRHPQRAKRLSMEQQKMGHSRRRTR